MNYSNDVETYMYDAEGEFLNEMSDENQYTGFFINDEQLQHLIDTNYTIVHSQTSSFLNKKWSPFEIVLPMIYGVVLLCGICSNIWVLKAALQVLRIGKNTTRSILFYIVELCCVNLVVLTFMPATLTDMIFGSWPFGNFMCKAHWTVESMNKTMASLVISLLTLASYCAVCRPGNRSLYDNKRLSALFTVLMTSILFGVSRSAVKHASVIHFGQVENDSVVNIYFTKCLVSQDDGLEGELYNFSIWSFVCGYVIPLIMMLLCYSSILFKLCYQHSLSKRRVNKFCRVLKSVLLLVCFYLLSWTPYWTITLLLSSDMEKGRKEASPFMYSISFIVHLLPYVNCAFSTLLYAVLNSDIRSTRKNKKRGFVSSRHSVHICDGDILL